LAEVALIVILNEYFAVVALSDAGLRNAVHNVTFLQNLHVEEAIISPMVGLIFVVSLFFASHALSNG